MDGGRRTRALAAALGLILVLWGGTAAAERVKDIASVLGVRSNHLIGYGLVVGLNGTGDSSNTPFTDQSIHSLLNRLGITVPPGVKAKSKNVAAVMVSAVLPPFAKPGQYIDVTVSSLGNAKSLRGGTLLMTPLKGLDGQVYAVAQGNLIVGGLDASGADGSRITINVPSAGRIPNGALVERSVPTAFARGSELVLTLHTADFTTAHRLAQAINDRFGPGRAAAVDAASVRVTPPPGQAARVSFVAELENLTLEPGEAPARVVINARTGTVVIGKHVRVTAAAVSHGNLVVTISERAQVSQPAPFSRGTTQVVPQSQVDVNQEDNRMFLFQPGVTLEEIVEAVNRVGAAPGDLVAILEALKEAGALRAELVVI